MKLKGYNVTIVELLDWILPTMFCEETARRLETDLRGYGIEVLTGEKVEGIEGDTAVSASVRYSGHRHRRCARSGAGPNGWNQGESRGTGQ